MVWNGRCLFYWQAEIEIISIKQFIKIASMFLTSSDENLFFGIEKEQMILFGKVALL